ncbi:MAG: sulfotransferase [Candidatus Pacebacteria bacterium]|jgi:hypothetical protein|nr:sulfotransferase [Candidatus Paceibacterota bacterium]
MQLHKHTGPSFIGIGAPHAGLGQVVTWLSEHEDVADSIPACNFFNTTAYEKKGLAWYEERLRSGVKHLGQKTGDCTPGYLTTPGVAERIVSHYADSQLFVIVRHPLRRALAEYEVHRKLDVHAATMSAAEYLTKFDTLQRYSRYAEYLDEYFGYYSPVGLQVLVYEEIAAAPLEAIQRLYHYIGVDKNVIPKSLRQFAPPPEPPKNPGLIKRSIMKGKATYKKLTVKPVGPVFGLEPQVEMMLSPAEQALFTKAFIAPTERLSHLMGRDMVAFWELDNRGI